MSYSKYHRINMATNENGYSINGEPTPKIYH